MDMKTISLHITDTKTVHHPVLVWPVPNGSQQQKEGKPAVHFYTAKLRSDCKEQNAST
jgi:hypothetical protein